MEKVFVGAPIRNRGWILTEHLRGIFKQQGIIPEFCYVLNDSIDDTEDILKKNDIRYVRHNMERPTRSEVRGTYSFDALAEVRNVLLKQFLKSDCEYLFSIDSDIILQSDTSIKDLILDDKDVVAALISNSPEIFAHNLLINKKRPNPLPLGLMEVDTTGAVYLIKRKVIEAGVRYSGAYLGEDYGFCEAAKALGFKLFCDTSIPATHAYAPGKYLMPKLK